MNYYLIVLIVIPVFNLTVIGGGHKKKKDPRDYTDADIYRLEEQWTVFCFVFFYV